MGSMIITGQTVGLNWTGTAHDLDLLANRIKELTGRDTFAIPADIPDQVDPYLTEIILQAMSETPDRCWGIYK